MKLLNVFRNYLHIAIALLLIMVGGGLYFYVHLKLSPTLACLGDSVTKAIRKGVTEKDSFCLNMAISGGYRAINAGKYSDDSLKALNRMEKDVLSLSPKPSCLLVMLGENDIFASEPLENYLANMGRIIDMAQAEHIPVTLMTPFPALDEKYRAAAPPYIAALKKLADNRKIPLIDVFGGLDSEKLELNSPETYSNDFQHPSPSGHAAITSMCKGDNPIWQCGCVVWLNKRYLKHPKSRMAFELNR